MRGLAHKSSMFRNFGLESIRPRSGMVGKEMKSNLEHQLEVRALKREYPQANSAFAHIVLAAFMVPTHTFEQYTKRMKRLIRIDARGAK